MDAEAITKLVQGVTKKWAKQRKAEERQANAKARRYEALTRSSRITIREAAWEVMEKAYLKASSNGTLPAHARQIMYAARGRIQELTGRTTLDDQYFTQTLLPDFMAEHADETAGWDVVFDARGHFEEPHTKRVVSLGTLEVREYLEKVGMPDADELELELPRGDRFPTHGPENRFGAILFIEKEGFLPLFRKVKLAERYDVAIMSTKGMSVTASRLLIDQLCGRHERLRLLVLHDFDKAGFSIVGTLQRDTRRYEFENEIEVVDLGLRLGDVKANRLESETVHYRNSNPTWNLRENGATDEEIKFLSGDGYRGQRVELNAFTSADLVRWIEEKLKDHRVEKVVPDGECLDEAYRRALEIELLEEELEGIREKVRGRVKEAKVPRGLASRVRKRFKADPELSWDEALLRELPSREDA